MKELVAQRIPPGDRWTLLNDDNDVVYGSLTDCLNQVFVVHVALPTILGTSLLRSAYLSTN